MHDIDEKSHKIHFNWMNWNFGVSDIDLDD